MDEMLSTEKSWITHSRVVFNSISEHVRITARLAVTQLGDFTLRHGGNRLVAVQSPTARLPDLCRRGVSCPLPESLLKHQMLLVTRAQAPWYTRFCIHDQWLHLRTS